MTLYEEWKDLAGSQTEETFEEFWSEYSSGEKKIYSDVLSSPYGEISGTIKEMIHKYDVRPVIYMGFLDGINSSLKKPQDLSVFDEDSSISMEIEPETLFYNMLAAGADHLFNLPQWNDILSEERREELMVEFRNSKTVRRKTPKIGRNDPCPCGSGQKYKRCCGRNG